MVDLPFAPPPPSPEAETLRLEVRAFGCLLEGVSGFGTPIAITSALLVALGFRAIDAIVFTLMFNTAPVAFGALGSPVTTLAAVTQLHDVTLGAMIGRQLPIFSVIVPIWLTSSESWAVKGRLIERPY